MLNSVFLVLYRFKVCAVNEAGNSDYSLETRPVKMQDIFESPNYELDADMRESLTVQAGNSVRLFVKISGKPAPSCEWFKDNKEVTSRAKINITNTYSLMVIPECIRDDTGKYELNLKNAAGSKALSVSVTVLDSPGPVDNFRVKEVTKNTVSLSWDYPLNDGGSTVENYIVEKRLISRKAWSTMATDISRLSVKVSNLEEGEEYYFRIMAENKFGIGVPTELPNAVKTSEVILICIQF